jgi:hypothetical protein
MTQTQWDDIYTALYEVYEQVSLKDEQVRSTIGDALDRLIDINPRNKVFRMKDYPSLIKS